MPPNAAAAAATDQYRADLAGQAAAARAVVAALWESSIDSDRIDLTFARFLPLAGRAVTAAQLQAVNTTARYHSAYMAAAFATPPAPVGPPADIAGATRDGRPIAAVLATASIATKLAIARGAAPSEALAAGVKRAARVAVTETQEAARAANAALMEQDPRIVGWRRVTSGNPCGACLALADDLRGTSDNLTVHAACACSAEPVVGGQPERTRRPDGPELFESLTYEEQNRLFLGRGGERKAALIRNGDISLGDLVTVEKHPQWPDTIVETRLARLPV